MKRLVVFAAIGALVLAAAGNAVADEAPPLQPVDDVQGADQGREDFDVFLRAESGRARGGTRTYSLIYTVSDPAGNSATARADMRVQAP